MSGALFAVKSIVWAVYYIRNQSQTFKNQIQSHILNKMQTCVKNLLSMLPCLLTVRWICNKQNIQIGFVLKCCAAGISTCDYEGKFQWWNSKTLHIYLCSKCTVFTWFQFCWCQCIKIIMAYRMLTSEELFTKRWKPHVKLCHSLLGVQYH